MSLVLILECYLHAFIKIRERGKHLKEAFHQLSQKVWQVYHAMDANAFRIQAAELLSWAESNTTDYVLGAVRKLCAKVDRFVLAYCLRARAKQPFSSPAHQLNGFVYHDNWLHNLMISTSMSGVRR